MSLSAAQVDQAWKKLGMEVRDTGDRHAIFRHEGKFILKTRRSHGSGKIEGNIPHMIRQQLKLNQDQFDDLIACPLTREKYIEILRAKGLIPQR